MEPEPISYDPPFRYLDLSFRLFQYQCMNAVFQSDDMTARMSAVQLRYGQEEGGVYVTRYHRVSEYNKLSIAAPQIQSRSHLID